MPNDALQPAQDPSEPEVAIEEVAGEQAAEPSQPGIEEIAQRFANVYMERELRQRALPTRVVGYMDMLGFGSLVRKHPGAFNVEFDEEAEVVSTSISKSSERFGRFHAVLDKMAVHQLDASRPERMMIFSDCAFAIYDNALQAAVSMTAAMRQFLSWSIPVRMGIAKGTCHFERFSIESFETFNLTRSMFYGSGIVDAVQTEENAGAGCRMFLSKSLSIEDRGLIEGRLTVLPIPAPSSYAEYELNYLNEPDPTGATDPSNLDLRLYRGLTMLKSELRGDAPARVMEQYDESFALFNRMRARLGRYEILAPRFDADGNYIDPRS